MLWRVLAALSLLCGGVAAWLLFTSAAGPRMMAAAQLFILGAAAALGCAGVAAAIGDSRKRLVGVAILGGYVLALVAFLMSVGNVR